MQLGTIKPAQLPTILPTISPTISPQPNDALASEDPSSAPTLAEKSSVIVAFMGLSPWGSSSTLADREKLSHEGVTATHIERWILSNIPSVQEVDATVNIGNNQEIIDPAAIEGGRFLQVAERTLFVRCDVSLFYKSRDEENDVEGWVFSAFEDPDDVQAYITSLQRRSDVFQAVENVVVEVEGYDVPSTPSRGERPETSPEKDSKVAVIAGAAVGGTALILLAAFFFMRKNSDAKSAVQEPNYLSNSSPGTTGQPKMSVAA
jgi:hypothetical protein